MAHGQNIARPSQGEAAAVKAPVCSNDLDSNFIITIISSIHDTVLTLSQHISNIENIHNSRCKSQETYLIPIVLVPYH